MVIAVSVLLAAVLTAQPAQVGAPPRAALSGRLYGDLAAPPIEVVLVRLESLDRRLENMWRDQAFISEQQKVVIKQLDSVIGIQSQVVANVTQSNAADRRIDDLEKRMEKVQDSGAGSSPRLAVLETKMDAMASLMLWLLGMVGSLVGGAIVFLSKRRITAFFRRLSKVPA